MRRALLWVWVAGCAFAQGDLGRIGGTVFDATGAVIPGAKVSARNEKTGQVRETAAGEQGVYVLPGLAPATYTVTAAAPGMGAVELSGIPLTAGQERTVDLRLKPAAVEQSVTVSGGELVVIDVSSARMGANIPEREVSNLPLNGRQVSQLYLMTPGAVTSGGGSFDNIRFSGRANQQNATRVDGIENSAIIDASPGNLNGESSSGFRLQNSLEIIQEFRVESSNYPAEYGTGTGGQIMIVTKSGGNALHGAMFETVRNDVFDARNFFDGAKKSPLRLNQFGGSLGGPIRRNRTFFFGAFEALRQRAGYEILETVPSLTARARAVDSIRPVLAAFPAGFQPTANPDLDLARLSAGSTMDESFGFLRLDHKINDRLQLSLRYNRAQGSQIQPLGVTGNQFRVTAVPQNAMVQLQQIFSPRLLHETKVGFNGYKTRAFGWAPPVPGVDMSAISIAFTGDVALTGIGGQGASAGAARPGGLVRSNSTQNGRGQPYTNYSFNFLDALTWTQGAHTVKAGMEIRPLRLYTDRLGGTTYTFSNINDLLANRPSQVQFLGDLSMPSPWNGGITGNRLAKQTYLIGYAQDEWRLGPSVTLNYGLRYEYYTVLSEARNGVVIFDTVHGGILPNHTPFYRSLKTNFGPRLGVSWAPKRFGQQTVFRVGAGYYFGPGQTEDQIQPIESDRVSRTLRNVSFPIDPAQILRSYDIHDPNLGFQPRAYAPGYTLPEKVLSYTASLQQALPSHAVLTVAYVGSQGRNLFLRSWTNLITGVSMDPITGVGRPVLEFGDRFAQIDYKTSGGTDHYDSLQVSVQRRFSRGLTLGGQWTYGHSIGNTGGSNEAQTATNPWNFQADRGNNAFDIRHSANVAVLYELPGFRRRSSTLAKTLLQGWQVGGSWNARTGLPVDVKITRPDIVYRDTRTGAYVNAPILEGGRPVTEPVINVPGGGAFRNVRRPDVVAGVSPFLQGAGKTHYLNPAAFSMPAPGSFGNLGRGAIHGPGLSQLDLTLQKSFTLHEKVSLAFRSEFYNVLNRANFANPPATLANALGVGGTRIQPGQAFTAASAGGNFGVFDSTVERTVGLGTGRQMQLGLRLSF